MKQNIHLKRALSVVLSALMLASMLPLSIFAVAGEGATPIATYDSLFTELTSAASGAANNDISSVDYSGGKYVVSGLYDGSAFNSATAAVPTYRWNNDLVISAMPSWSFFNNCSVITNGGDANYSGAVAARLARAGNGEHIKFSFVAPENGEYLLVPKAFGAAGGKSMLLQHKADGAVAECNQTLKITKGTTELFTKTLALGENYASVTDDLPSDLTVTLMKDETLDFTFTTTASWAITELYINFDMQLTKQLSTAVEGVSFASQNYLVEKTDTSLNIAPVVNPSSAADKSVTYTIEDEDVLSVDKDGNVTPKAEGFTKVTATTTDGGFTAETTVGVYDETKASVYTMSSYKTETGALLSNASTADNPATNAWQGMYKKSDGTWARMEKLYKSANDIVSHPSAVLMGETHNYPNLTQFGANDDDEVMLNFGHGNIDYKAEDASDLRTYIRRGTALVFTAQKDGIYSFDGSEIAFTNATINYMTNDTNARTSTTTVKFYLNGQQYGNALTLDYNTQSVAFPTANCITMKAGDTFMLEMSSTCWEKGQIALSPRAVWLFEKMPEKPVESVTLTDESIVLLKGATHSLVASVLPETASDKTLVYTSSDENVVTVSDTGVITAVASGKATVTATSKSTPSVSDSVTVKVPYDDERFLEELWDAALDATTKENTLESAVFSGAFTAGIFEDGKYNDFSYALRHDWGNPRAVLYTSNENETGQSVSNQYLSLYDDSGSKASISSYIDGENVYIGYRAQKNGKYTISAADGAPNIALKFVRGGNVTDMVNWGEDKPTGIRITKNGQKIWPTDAECVELKPSGPLEIPFPTLENVVLYKGDTLRVEVIGQSGVGRHVSVVLDFDVQFEETASVATAVTGITLSHEKVELYEGEKTSVTASVSPENATNKNIRFESSDNSVVTVSQYGEITGVKNGTATIYAISLDNGEIKDSCVVSVLKAYPAENMLDHLWSDALDAATEESTPTTKEYSGIFAAGTVKDDGYYTDFPYVLRQTWGIPRAVLYMPNNEEYGDVPDNSISIYDNNGTDAIDIFPYTDGVATYVAFRAEQNGIYDIKAAEGFSDIMLKYRRSATADDMVDWGEDAPIKIKITKNGKQIWPAGDAAVLAPSGAQSVAFPTLSGQKLYKGDTIRVEVLGSAKLNHHVCVSLNFTAQLKNVLAVQRPVTAVKFPKSSYTISMYDSLFVGASVVPGDANNQNLVYSSSDSSVVSVNAYGVVTGNKEGKATIYAKSVENPSIMASCVVTVKKAYEAQNMIKNLWDAALALAQKEGELVRASYDSGFVAGRLDTDGLYNDFTYAIRQDWGTPRAVLYTSDSSETGSGQSNQYLSLYDSNGDKAAVGSYVDGESVYVGYRAQSNGKYTISAANGEPNISIKTVRMPAKDKNGKLYTFEEQIEMIKKWEEDKPIGIRITKNGQKIWPTDADCVELNAAGPLEIAFPTIENVLLYKGDTLRLEVMGQSGVNRHINISFAFDVKKTEDVSVKNPVKSISLDSTKCTLSIDEVYPLTAKVSPANADNKNVRFVSSDPSVAVVDSLGRITALKEGAATVYAISEDNESIKASCAVTVTDFRIIHYTPDELKADLDTQLKGAEVVNAKPVEFGTNWTPQYSLDGGKTFETLGALNTTIYENNKAGDLSSYSFRWTNKDSVGLEKYYGTYQPFMTTEGTTMALAFTATRAGTYSVSGDERNPFIHLPATYTGGRVPAEDADKEFIFAIYLNDKKLYSYGLSVKNSSVAFPEITGIKMNANDVLRFVMFDNEKASSQMAFYFYPKVSLVKPDPRELAPVTESKLYILEPNTEYKGVVKAVHPNGLPIDYQIISKGNGGTLTLGEGGRFTYKPRKDYKGIDTYRVKCADSRGLFSVATLTFMVSVKYDAVADLSTTCISMDKKFTGEATPLTFPEYGWKYQFTYDGLTYANGAPQYMNTNSTQVIKNPGWWGYVMYSSGMPQATVEAMDGTAVVNCMAGHEPWGVNPVGAVSFIAPYDATWLLTGNDLFNKFKIGTDPENPEFKKPVKVWISKNGQKIWPADADYLEISKETQEIEFPELTVAMKQGDSIRVCISGHTDNLRLNRVAVAPVIYDIGVYDAKLDPYAIPEAGIVITDDDGEPMVRYPSFSTDEKSLSLLREGLSEPIEDRGLTVNKIKRLTQLDKFKLLVEFERCESAYGYRVLVYSVKDGAYKIFQDTTVYELSCEIAGLDAGDYVVQVIALDSLGQFLEIYSPRSFTVDKDGQINAQNGLSAVTMIIIIAAAVVLLAGAVAAFILIKSKRKNTPKEA